jgi:hypothetical protein
LKKEHCHFLQDSFPFSPANPVIFAGVEGGLPTCHRDRVRRLGLEVEQPPEQLDAGPDAQIRLAKGGEHGQDHHRIRPNVMQMEVIQELSQEVARGQHEAPSEMLEEYHRFSGLGRGHHLATGRVATQNICR